MVKATAQPIAVCVQSHEPGCFLPALGEAVRRGEAIGLIFGLVTILRVGLAALAPEASGVTLTSEQRAVVAGFAVATQLPLVGYLLWRLGRRSERMWRAGRRLGRWLVAGQSLPQVTGLTIYIAMGALLALVLPVLALASTATLPPKRARYGRILAR